MTLSRGSRSRSALILLGLLAVPCVCSSLAAGWGLPAVVASGMCPPAPPDIPAYACSPLDYLLRMTLGPWALAGHLVLWCTWAGLVAAVGLMAYVVRRSRTTQRGLPPSLTLKE